MTTSTIFPYRVLVGDEISVGVRSDELEQRADESWDAQSVDDSAALTIDVHVDVADLEKCLTPGEQPSDACEVVLLLESVSSRRRECVARLPVASQVSFNLDLAKRDHRGLIEISASVVRNVDCEGAQPGRAAAVGDLLGRSAPIRVHFDEPHAAPGSSIEIEWRDFANDAVLAAQEDLLFAIEDSEPPKILLNSGVKLLHDILMSPGVRGRKAKIRDAIFMQIAHQGWSSLLADAASAAFQAYRDLEPAGDPDADQVFQELGGWRAAILGDWAPWLLSEPEADLASERLIADIADGIGRLVIDAVPRAIQTRLGTRKSFDGLVAEMHLIGDE